MSLGHRRLGCDGQSSEEDRNQFLSYLQHKAVAIPKAAVPGTKIWQRLGVDLHQVPWSSRKRDMK